MVGRDEYDDDYEDRPARRASNAPVLVAAVVGGGLVLVVLFGVIAALFLSFRQGQVAVPPPPVGAAAEPPPGPNTPATKRYTREEFRQLIMGKPMNDVVKLVGKPVDTTDVRGNVYWYYTGITYDPVTGKTDERIQVRFTWGAVTNVNY